MSPGKVIVQIEKYRRKLATVAPGDSGKLLAISRKIDLLIMEYYRSILRLRPKSRDTLRRFRNRYQEKG